MGGGHGRRATFTDYGPYATLGRGPSRVPESLAAWEEEFVGSGYGDEVGEAYGRSVSEFVSGLPEPLVVWAHARLNALSLGGHGLAMGAWRDLMERGKGGGEKDGGDGGAGES